MEVAAVLIHWFYCDTFGIPLIVERSLQHLCVSLCSSCPKVGNGSTEGHDGFPWALVCGHIKKKSFSQALIRFLLYVFVQNWIIDLLLKRMSPFPEL